MRNQSVVSGRSNARVSIRVLLIFLQRFEVQIQNSNALLRITNPSPKYRMARLFFLPAKAFLFSFRLESNIRFLIIQISDFPGFDFSPYMLPSFSLPRQSVVIFFSVLLRFRTSLSLFYILNLQLSTPFSKSTEGLSEISP